MLRIYYIQIRGLDIGLEQGTWSGHARARARVQYTIADIEWKLLSKCAINLRSMLLRHLYHASRGKNTARDADPYYAE